MLVTIKMVQSKFSPGLGEIDSKKISTLNPGIFFAMYQSKVRDNQSI